MENNFFFRDFYYYDQSGFSFFWLGEEFKDLQEIKIK
jgi:hypothetical protein